MKFQYVCHFIVSFLILLHLKSGILNQGEISYWSEIFMGDRLTVDQTIWYQLLTVKFCF